MSFRCPGYLNAKSLLADGDCGEDYREWFSNPALSSCRLLIDNVYRTMQYRGDGPVLLVHEVSDESALVFRFTMGVHDRLGRKHQRCEAMLVESLRLPALLNGEFDSVPDEETKEFVVDSVDRSPLPHCQRHGTLTVYARDSRAYWFKGESLQAPTISRRDKVERPKPSFRMGQVGNRQRKERNAMFKVAVVLLIALCLAGGWGCFQFTREMETLRMDLGARDKTIANCQTELEKLRNENNRLRSENAKFDKWVKTRSNFEVNKVQLQVKFDEIVKDFREAEKLLAHMDATPVGNHEKGGRGTPLDTSANQRQTLHAGDSAGLPDGDASKRGIIEKVKDLLP